MHFFSWGIWWYNIDRPINTYAKEANDWNNALDAEDTTINNLNVLTKLKEDKKHFTSTEDFKKYFNDKNSRSKAYNSYWYYLHFNNVTKDDGANEKTKIVINDYKSFNDARKKYLKSSDKVVFKVILSIIWIIILLVLFFVLVIVSWDLYRTYNEFKTIKNSLLNNQRAEIRRLENKQEQINQEFMINNTDYRNASTGLRNYALKKNIDDEVCQQIINDAVIENKPLDVNSYNLTSQQKSGLPDIYNRLRNAANLQWELRSQYSILENRIDSLKKNMQ